MKNSKMITLKRNRWERALAALIALTLVPAAGAPTLAMAAGFDPPSSSINFQLDCKNETAAQKFCSQYFIRDSDGSARAIVDEAECSAHGAANEGQVSGTNHDYGGGNCSAIISLNDLRADSSLIIGPPSAADPTPSDFNLTPTQLTNACKRATQVTKSCKLKGSQLEPHCVAILAISGDGDFASESKDGAITFNTLLLGMNVAGAAICTAACASTAVGGAGNNACTIAGMLGSAAEIAASLGMKQNGEAMRFIGATGGIIGLGGSIAATQATASTSGTGATTGSADKVSCAMAVYFGVMAVTRAIDLGVMESTREKSCNALNQLMSDMTKPQDPNGGSGTGRNVGGGAPNPGDAGHIGSGDGSTASSGNRGSLIGQNSVSDTPIGRPANTQAAEAQFNNATSTDAKLLRQMSGRPSFDVAKALGDKARKEGAANTLASMVGGSGEIGAALAGLVKDVEANPGKYRDISGQSGSSYSSGGGAAGGSGAKSGGGDNPFANLFAGGAKDGGARAPSSEQFGKVVEDDIWHSKSTMNLFEIVSNKVSKVTTRVGVK